MASLSEHLSEYNAAMDRAEAAVLLALLLWAGTARAQDIPEVWSVTIGSAAVATMTVSADGDVEIGDWHVGPRVLSLRLALAVAHLVEEVTWCRDRARQDFDAGGSHGAMVAAEHGCFADFHWSLPWTLWHTLLDEAGRSARTWGETP